MPTAYLSFMAEINPQSANSLIATVLDQVQQGASEIYLLLSSTGGQVMWGMTAYNVMKGLPVPVTTHNVGNIDSATNILFLAGKSRHTCRHATFAFHGVAASVPAGTAMAAPMLKNLISIVAADDARIAGVLSQESELSLPEAQALMLAAETKDAAYAVTSGIAHDVLDLALPDGVQVIRVAAP